MEETFKMLKEMARKEKGKKEEAKKFFNSLTEDKKAKWMQDIESERSEDHRK